MFFVVVDDQTIGFVQHQVRHVGEHHVTTLGEVVQTARGGHQQVEGFVTTAFFDLFVDGTTVHRRRMNAVETSKAFGHGAHLLGQFTRGANYQGDGRGGGARGLGGGVGESVVNVGHGGKKESEGFATAGGGLRENVMAGQRQWPGLSLDGGGCLKVALGEVGLERGGDRHCQFGLSGGSSVLPHLNPSGMVVQGPVLVDSCLMGRSGLASTTCRTRMAPPCPTTVNHKKQN
jgi:hypothetical protein